MSYRDLPGIIKEFVPVEDKLASEAGWFRLFQRAYEDKFGSSGALPETTFSSKTYDESTPEHKLCRKIEALRHSSTLYDIAVVDGKVARAEEAFRIITTEASLQAAGKIQTDETNLAAARNLVEELKAVFKEKARSWHEADEVDPSDVLLIKEQFKAVTAAYGDPQEYDESSPSLRALADHRVTYLGHCVRSMSASMDRAKQYLSITSEAFLGLQKGVFTDTDMAQAAFEMASSQGDKMCEKLERQATFVRASIELLQNIKDDVNTQIVPEIERVPRVTSFVPMQLAFDF